MARIVDFSGVQTSHLLPDGYYDAEIRALVESSTSTGCLMYTLEYVLLAPKAAAGKPFKERFFIGKLPFEPKADATPEEIEWAKLDDPDAEDPITWRKNGRKLKTRCESADYPLNGTKDMAVLCAELVGKRLGLRITETVDSRKTSKFYGQPQNTVQLSYTLGREEARLDRDADERRAARGRTNRAVEAPEAPVRARRRIDPVDEEYDAA